MNNYYNLLNFSGIIMLPTLFHAPKFMGLNHSFGKCIQSVSDIQNSLHMLFRIVVVT